MAGPFESLLKLAESEDRRRGMRGYDMKELTLRLRDVLLAFLTVEGSKNGSSMLVVLDLLQSCDGWAILERCIGGIGHATASATFQVRASALLSAPVSTAAGEMGQTIWSGELAVAAFGADESDGNSAEEDDDGNQNQCDKQCRALKIER